ncbi:hypothetical protein EN904_26900 [Mesorhizobium sp. M7A.F.Ca.CA.001.07.2.1]|uniref:hypothetical protein n=2 Tax=Phyllobacteriaceae TaxID=69277 RepID=UPI000FCCCB7B|nr:MULTISPECIES: hypothetical protein [Mesorhizobium]MCF6122069.1 hypothetical protein [Mesorhizobium ciceri]MCQ8812650.1 hypothetical protein [Mesorhizobium sp. SEMIA396]RUX78922.1 hypothetical protein EN983_14340 [Mesorhizobium sp. M7A.F.Ca.CA.004.08.2.1]RUX83292.1 hypothetical protein EN982_27835 [Mesorhizobium sp. M7A.F.Ca.CA.004.08.1.1]RUY04820.1 hypothetical protein EN985_12190 [Mesorhizobium sp. M7A.F.Ca.CA.004.04.1.1]
MDTLQFEIARFLAAKALHKRRTTYQQVGEAVGWNHPTGRGLGRNLEVILHYLADRGLPPLTTILVKKGERHPAEDAMAYIRSALGAIDIEAAQQEVFAFDWTSVPELAPATDTLPDGRQVWLTSFWGFDPASWGCIGFADEARRARYLSNSKPGTLVAIYVTKGKGPENMRGKVVGVLEISHEIGHAQEFISGDRWAEKERDQDSRGKWLYAVKATRAWRIVPEDWRRVEELFPQAYRGSNAELIGANGVPVSADEAAELYELDVYEVPVYGQTEPVDPTIQTLESALSPSRAVRPASRPYWVGETNGPKHLYILRLVGNIGAYLGRRDDEVEDKHIIKVGFSKSPQARRDQIQSAYPRGAFHWEVFKPSPQPDTAPYASAEIAIAGEDAMKKRLVEDGAEVLGGEFFLADDNLIYRIWAAGSNAAKAAQDGLRNQQFPE